jgi:hypothetical protein
MYIARLICSDADCGEEVTAETATLEELESLICECGCALVVVGWPDAAGEVVLLRARTARGSLSDAA